MLTLRDGVLFRTKRFIPDYRYTQSFLATLSVDEVCLVDVGEDRESFFHACRLYADKCFSPLTIGGKVKDLQEARMLFREVGADKILVHGGRLDLIRALSRRWGNQAAVAGVDYSNSQDPVPLALECEEAGAGEILLTSIERDGSLQGYDLEALERVVEAVSVPVVASGGCGGWFHMKEAFEVGASGAATSVIHHFTEPSLSAFKRNLENEGVRVRP